MIKKNILFFLTLFLLSGCLSNNIAAIPDYKGGGGHAGTANSDKPTISSRNSIVQTASSQLGVPYHFGGASPSKGFDCSGLIYWTYSQHGVKLPRVTTDQIKSGTYVSRNRLRAGDLVFFKMKDAPNGLHAGIYAGNNSFIHSPNSRSTVRVDSLNNSYWDKNYHTGRRI